MSERREAARVIFAGGGTGGHLYPALALASEFRDRGAEVMFVGASRGIEARVLPERGVPHVLLPMEPIRRSRPWQNWRLIPALFRSLRGLSRVIREFQPDLVVGTGGYVTGPVAGWAALRGIPMALQEQNSYPGLMTRWLSSRADQIHLAFPEALRHLKLGSRTEVFELGNPITPPDATIDPSEARSSFGLGRGPIALVVGGSQGARSVNEALLSDLEGVFEGRLAARPPGMEILWAAGRGNYDAAHERVAELGLDDWVHVHAYIDEMPTALATADLAISRAGAMALAELCAWGIPAVLVPYPHAAADHQRHNARALADVGAAVMLEERELEPGRLWTELVSLAVDPDRRTTMATRARERGHPHAAREIVDELQRLLT